MFFDGFGGSLILLPCFVLLFNVFLLCVAWTKNNLAGSFCGFLCQRLHQVGLSWERVCYSVCRKAFLRVAVAVGQMAKTPGIGSLLKFDR